MTALERIEEIEKRPPFRPNTQVPLCAVMNAEYELLLKAFRLMREIAIAYKEQAGHRKGLEPGDFGVDKEFEISMRMKNDKVLDGKITPPREA